VFPGFTAATVVERRLELKLNLDPLLTFSKHVASKYKVRELAVADVLPTSVCEIIEILLRRINTAEPFSTDQLAPVLT
jgi:hypothetical protein